MQRSITILGRKEGESVDFAKLIYPPMQVADIFTMGVNIAHAGMDQRKAHVIARDVAGKMKVSPLLDANGERIKPVCVHHPLLLGMKKPPIWSSCTNGARRGSCPRLGGFAAAAGVFCSSSTTPITVP